MQHRPDTKYGENIYYFFSSDRNSVVSGKDAVVAWYSEIKDHTFFVEPKTMKTGHFTQVVWSDSRELGVGSCTNR